MKQKIVLTGKETKKQLVDLLIAGKANHDGNKWDKVKYYAQDDKRELLRKVKTFNLSTKGDFAAYYTFGRNDAYRYGKKIRKRLKLIGSQPDKDSRKKAKWKRKFDAYYESCYHVLTISEARHLMKIIDDSLKDLGIIEGGTDRPV